MRSLNLQQNWDLDLFRVRGDWLKLVLCVNFRRNLPSWPRIRTIGLLLYFNCTKQIQFLSVCRLGRHCLKDPRQPARGSWTLEFCEGVVGFVSFSWNAPNTHVCFVCWHELPNIYVHYVGLAIDPKRAPFVLDFTRVCVPVVYADKPAEHIELPAKPLDYFLRSNKSNINQ